MKPRTWSRETVPEALGSPAYANGRGPDKNLSRREHIKLQHVAELASAILTAFRKEESRLLTFDR
eukprot:5431858-Pyramimonas_sp.AAC.1